MLGGDCLDPKRRLFRYSLIILAGLFLFFLYRYIGSRTLGLVYPWNSFLFLPEDRFMDFFSINHMVADLDPYADASSYPPFALILAYFFTRVIPGSDRLTAMQIRDNDMVGQLWLFGLYFVCFAIIAVVIYRRIAVYFSGDKNIVKRIFSIGIVIGGILLMAPNIYALDRGNYLVICVLFLTLFCMYYGKNDYLAAVFLAFAASLKLFPVVLFLIFFLDKKWKPLLTGLLTGGLGSLVCMFFFKGEFLRNVWRFVNSLLGFSGGLDANHSYYYRYAVGLRSFFGDVLFAIKTYIPNWIAIDKLTLIASALLLVLVIVMCVYDKRFWRRIMYLSFLMILAPTPSFFYNLAYLLGPIVLFLTKDTIEKNDTWFFIGLAVLMIPTNYYYFLANCSDAPVLVGINCIINPLIMLALLCVGAVELIHNRKCNKDRMQKCKAP